MRYFLILIIGLLLQTTLFSQRNNRGPKTREIGVNMTSLLTQILPFQNATALDGPFQFQYKSGRNDKFFSFKLGARVNDIFDNNNFLNFAVGYNRRRPLTDHFDINIGYYFVVIGGSFNDPVNNANDASGVGFGWDLGFQWNINDRISLSTETTLFVGPSSNIFSITFIPPIGLFLTGRF